MKRKIILQLFAEEPTQGTPPTSTTPEPTVTEPNNGSEQDEGDEKKYSDKDLNEIIGKKFAKWQEKQQKAVDEAKKLAEMNATQKAEYERDQLQKELEELKKKDSLAEMTKTARKMLSDADVPVSDDLLAVMVTTNAEETKAAVDSYSKLFKYAVEKAVKERLRGETPRVGTGTSTTTVSEIDKRIKKYE